VQQYNTKRKDGKMTINKEENHLAHVGVIGMHWHHHKPTQVGTSSDSTRKNHIEGAKNYAKTHPKEISSAAVSKDKLASSLKKTPVYNSKLSSYDKRKMREAFNGKVLKYTSLAAFGVIAALGVAVSATALLPSGNIASKSTSSFKTADYAKAVDYLDLKFND
jgi:hypothetical protein